MFVRMKKNLNGFLIVDNDLFWPQNFFLLLLCCRQTKIFSPCHRKSFFSLTKRNYIFLLQCCFAFTGNQERKKTQQGLVLTFRTHKDTKKALLIGHTGKKREEGKKWETGWNSQHAIQTQPTYFFQLFLFLCRERKKKRSSLISQFCREKEEAKKRKRI